MTLLDYLVCALCIGITGLVWGLVVLIFHAEAGILLGLLIFILGFSVLVNNVRRADREERSYVQKK